MLQITVEAIRMNPCRTMEERNVERPFLKAELQGSWGKVIEHIDRQRGETFNWSIRRYESFLSSHPC